MCRGRQAVLYRRVVHRLVPQLRRPLRWGRWRRLLLRRRDCIVAEGWTRARRGRVDLFKVKGRNARLDALRLDFSHCLSNCGERICARKGWQVWLLGEKGTQRAARKNSERQGLHSDNHRYSGTVLVQAGLTLCYAHQMRIQFTFRQTAPCARLWLLPHLPQSRSCRNSKTQPRPRQK
jgi:hypothetical protein